MRPTIGAIALATASKPVYGQPCNGCGMCCLFEQCPLSEAMFGPKALCPALIDTGQRYACGLIAQPSRYFREGSEVAGSRAAGELLGIGTYCDSIETDADRAAEQNMATR